MAKNPGGGLYYPLDGNDMTSDVMPGRSADDPPPYSEVDPTGVDTVNRIASAPLPPVVPTNGTSSAIAFVAQKRDRFLRSRASTVSPTTTTTDSTTGATVVTRGVALASKSIDVVCPHCKADIRTSIEKRPGLLAYLSGAVMACLCCFCGCCLIPCCIEECMEVKHTCPNCDGLIGKYRL